MRIFSERQRFVAVVALAQVILDVVAGVTFAAVYDFDVGTLAADPGAFPARGADVAGLLRLGLVIDMLAYLALVPVVLYLHRRLSAAVSERVEAMGLVNVLTFGGLGFSLVGAIGAALYASVGPALLEASAAAPATATAARVAFAALANGVNVGLWGTLEWLLLGVWLIGVGWIVRAEGRAFAWLAVVAGVGALFYDARTGLSGHPPGDLTSPLDILIFGAFGLFVLWVVWLAIRLWRGR
jgi:hypothetical protein